MAKTIDLPAVAGARLQAWLAGDGPVNLVLVHGYPFDRTMWEPQVEELSGLARILVPDLRGLGQSELPTRGRTRMRDYADDLAAWMDHVEMDRAVISGLSMGGYVSFEMWRRHRGRVAALALLDTRAEADGPAAKEARVAARECIRREGMRAVVDDMLKGVLGATTLANRPRVVDHVRRMILDTVPTGAMAAVDAMRERPDSTDDLPGIDVPTLVVVGEEDTLTPPSQAEAIAGAIPGAELVRIPRCGHVSSLEAPTAVTAELQKLLQRAALA